MWLRVGCSDNDCQRPASAGKRSVGADGKDSGALAALKPGAPILTPARCRLRWRGTLLRACAERKVHFLDAPVTGGDWGAKKGELIFMVGEMRKR